MDGITIERSVKDKGEFIQSGPLKKLVRVHLERSKLQFRRLLL